MLIELHNGLRDAVRLPATRAIIWVEQQPIAIIMTIGSGVEVLRLGDKSFETALRIAGIDIVSVVDQIDTKAIRMMT